MSLFLGVSGTNNYYDRYSIAIFLIWYTYIPLIWYTYTRSMSLETLRGIKPATLPSHSLFLSHFTEASPPPTVSSLLGKEMPSEAMIDIGAEMDYLIRRSDPAFRNSYFSIYIDSY